jgi:hypothetical protein
MVDTRLAAKPHGDRSPVFRFHGTETPRGLQDVPRSVLHQGRFGRMFRHLPPFAPSDDDLLALAASMILPVPKDEEEDRLLDNKTIAAGFTYFGQFVDHDLTFDPNSKLQRDNDPDALTNFRTPRFDLDSLYGDGPADSPFFYQADGTRLLLGQDADGKDDLPRNTPRDPGEPRRALIGDPRNDENLIVSQLTLAITKFHNAVVEELAAHGVASSALFDEARRLVRWHYQWVVVHDFLTRIVGSDLVADVLRVETYHVHTKEGLQRAKLARPHLLFFGWKEQPFIPVEFSVAAYRFGHSMVRADYALNEATDGEDEQGNPRELKIFAEEGEDLRGLRERPPGLVIEWERFFKFPGKEDPQFTQKIDPKLVHGLSVLPDSVTGPIPPGPIATMLHSLAVRNLLRGKALGLPSGQSVAEAMGLPTDLILRGKALGLPNQQASAFGQDTPLWYYILREAERLCDGETLGPVGGRIVAEVFVGLLHADPSSFLRLQPTWEPRKRHFGAPANGKFAMTDLLHFAGVA